MNYKQRIIAVVALLVCAALTSYPPWSVGENSSSAGFHSFFRRPHHYAVIDIRTLAIEWVFVLLLALALAIWLGDNRTKG